MGAANQGYSVNSGRWTVESGLNPYRVAQENTPTDDLSVGV